MTPSQQIRRVRTERLALTQSEFASLLGVESQTVSNWERGVRIPTPSNIRAIALAGDVPVSWLFEEAEDAA